jgi:hypothetical protein
MTASKKKSQRAAEGKAAQQASDAGQFIQTLGAEAFGAAVTVAFERPELADAFRRTLAVFTTTEDAGLVSRLAAAMEDPQKADDITTAFINLSGTTHVHSEHPEVFPVFASVSIREARKYAEGAPAEMPKGGAGLKEIEKWQVAEHLRELEALAGE